VILLLERWLEGISAPSFRSLVWMKKRQGQWVIWFLLFEVSASSSYSALTLLDDLVHKNINHVCSQVGAICSRVWSDQELGFKPQPGRVCLPKKGLFAYQRIISNNSYAHGEQGDKSGQVKEGLTVSSKLWPLLTPWLAAAMLLTAPAWAEANRLGHTFNCVFFGLEHK